MFGGIVKTASDEGVLVCIAGCVGNNEFGCLQTSDCCNSASGYNCLLGSCVSELMCLHMLLAYCHTPAADHGRPCHSIQALNQQTAHTPFVMIFEMLSIVSMLSTSMKGCHWQHHIRIMGLFAARLAGKWHPWHPMGFRPVSTCVR